MKKILVPTDFSANANNAAKLARQLSANANVEIHLLHVVFTPADWDKMTDEMKDEYPESKSKVDQATQDMLSLVENPNLIGATVKGHLGYGNAQDEITKYIKNNAIDLVVVGSHGTSSKADLFIGSNTQRVMRSTDIPVIAVKESFELSALNKLVFASNLDKDAEVPFKKIKSLCDTINAEIELLYVNTPHNFKSTTEIDELVSKFKSNVNCNDSITIINEYEVPTGILKHCQHVMADMAALVNHRKAYAAHYQMGVTETLVFHADFPVISINVN